MKDLTGQELLSIDGQPVSVQAALRPDNRLAFSPQGPIFRFLGAGRLVEIEEAAPEQPNQAPADKDERREQEDRADGGPSRSGSFLKKLLRR